ncbi:MAG TPA: hypothetical protein VNM67_09100 [Thermoanaerobaculia bacterium]|jgi:hypothetical protein|nr:hypothetical protein [Thermoanaerobaculia bacterium]
MAIQALPFLSEGSRPKAKPDGIREKELPVVAFMDVEFGTFEIEAEVADDRYPLAVMQMWRSD